MKSKKNIPQRIYAYALRLVVDDYELIKAVTNIIDWANCVESGFMSDLYDPFMQAMLAMKAMISIGVTDFDCDVDLIDDALNLVSDGFSRFTVHNGCVELAYDTILYVPFFFFGIFALHQNLYIVTKKNIYHKFVCSNFTINIMQNESHLDHRHGIPRNFFLKIFEKAIKRQKKIGKRHKKPLKTYCQTVTEEICYKMLLCLFVEQNMYVVDFGWLLHVCV